MEKADGANVDNAIEDTIAGADRQWRAMGVVEADRGALVADLRGELAGAAADGVTPSQLIGHDLRGFARDVAVGAGVRRVPYDFRRLLRTALAGAAPGLFLAWLLIWRWWWLPLPFNDESVSVIVIRYAVCVAAVLAGGLYWVRRSMRGDPAVGRTVLAIGLLAPVAGGLAVPVTMAFAWQVGYSTTLPVLIMEAAIVAGALAGAIVLARRWALAPILGPAATSTAARQTVPPDPTA